MERSILRIISMLLCISLLCGMLPGAYAQETEEDLSQSAEIVEEAGETLPTQPEEPQAETEPAPIDVTEPAIEEETESTAEEPAEEPTEAPAEGIEEETTEAVEVPEEPESIQESSEETEAPTEELAQIPVTEETEPEETEPEETGYPWDKMDDDAFADFFRSEGYLAYEDDEAAQHSLALRVEAVEDLQLREELGQMLYAWLNPVQTVTFAEESTDAMYSAVARAIALADLNSSDMFFLQSGSGKCTLASAAMLVRRAARANGYTKWKSITESALKSTAWVDGVGLSWTFTYAGITVDKKDVSSCTATTIKNFLNEHKEGFVAYNKNYPHAILITDCTNGTIYCADPSVAGGRIKLVDSILGKSTQDATAKGFTRFWYVSSPKISVTLPSALADKPVKVTASPNGDNSVKLSWNDVGAAGYWIFRSDKPDGTFSKIHTCSGSETTWTDTGTEILRPYYYRVQSYDSSKTGAYTSATVSCTPDRNVAHLGDGTCGDDIRWAVYKDGMMLIQGTGLMTDYAAGKAPWYSIRTSIQEVCISEKITSIARFAFENCTAMNLVQIPSTVTAIGNNAFFGCTHLAEITLPAALRNIGTAAFQGCAALTAVSVPAKVTAIGDWAFGKCSQLEKVTLPATLTSIGEAMFYEDGALAEVNIPASVKTIGDYAFYGCSAVNNLTMAAGMDAIGRYAFAFCGKAFSELTFTRSSGAIDIGEGAFYHCGLTKLTLPSCKLGNQAFAECGSLKYVMISQNSTASTFGEELFCGDYAIGKILILGDPSGLNADAFCDTSAEVLVKGDFGAQVKNGVTWRSFQVAGACSGNAYYYLDSEGDLIFFGEGSVPGYSSGKAPWHGKASAIFAAHFGPGISSLGKYSFVDCSKLKDVYFAGSAPAFTSSSFSGLSGTVHYHNVSGTWTDVAGKNYGGKPTWQEDHDCTWRANAEPTFEASGELHMVCISCGAEATVEVPKLSREDYAYSEQGSYAVYTWKVTAYGNISIRVPLVTITAQPANCTVDLNAAASFRVAASGIGLTYQWQWRSEETDWADCDAGTMGYQSPEIRVTASEEKRTWQYRCAVTDANEKTVYSAEASMTIRGILLILAQPQNQVADENTAASFHVEAVATEPGYQWQYCAPGGSWVDCSSLIPGSRTDTLTPTARIEYHGYQYRCVITDYAGKKIVSAPAALSVFIPLTITLQPEDSILSENETAAFRVAADGYDLHYQWQQKPETGTWEDTDVSGANTAVLRPTANVENNGTQYRCIVTDYDGKTVTSDAAYILLDIPVRITTHPMNAVVEENTAASFTVGASGTLLQYQWQWRTGNSSWIDCNASIEGSNSAILRPIGQVSRNGFQYRCAVTDYFGNTVYSSAGTLIIRLPLRIISQPVSITANENTVAAFTVASLGSAVRYQWQYRTASSSWQNCTEKMPGYNTAFLKVDALMSRNGWMFRCIVRDMFGNVLASSAATLLVRAALPVLRILEQPQNVTAEEGSTAVIAVSAEGVGLRYQWQWKTDDRDWANCTSVTQGFDTAALTLTANMGRNGYQYRCIIRDSAGQSVVTRAVLLTVTEALRITSQPASKVVRVGTPVQFTVSAAGTGLQYQWQWKTASRDWTDCTSVTPGYNTSTLEPTANSGHNGYQYRCIITDALGRTAISKTAVLVIY